jgi:hypothetical protein
MGQTHVELDRYRDLIGDLADALKEDVARCVPLRTSTRRLASRRFCADMLEHGAGHARVSTLSGLSLEDMFVSRGGLEQKAALEGMGAPAGEGERNHFDHPPNGRRP